MGDEFGQFNEWNANASLDWHLTDQSEMNAKMLAFNKALNKFYVEHRAFWQVDFDWNGFSWIDSNDNENSIFSFIRKADNADDYIIILSNFTPEVRQDYRIGVPDKGTYIEVFNSDRAEFGGSGVLNEGDIYTEDIGLHNRAQSIKITVPPLATIYLRLKDAEERYKVATAKNEAIDVPYERADDNVWQAVDEEKTIPQPRRNSEKPAKAAAASDDKPLKRQRRKLTEEEKAARREKMAANRAAKKAVGIAPKQSGGNPKKESAVDKNEPKKRQRRKLTEEEKAARREKMAANRAAKEAAGIAPKRGGKKPKTKE